MSREKTMGRKGKILSRPRIRKFDMRSEDLNFEGNEKRKYSELSDVFSVMQKKADSSTRLFSNEMPPVYKEVGGFIIKVFGDEGMIGIIDRELHPELDHMELDEIKKVESGFIKYFKFDEENFHSLAVKINSEDVMPEAAQTFCLMFPELFGKYKNGDTPKNLKDLCKVVGLNKDRDEILVGAHIRLTLDLCFSEVKPSSKWN